MIQERELQNCEKKIACVMLLTGVGGVTGCLTGGTPGAGAGAALGFMGGTFFATICSLAGQDRPAQAPRVVPNNTNNQVVQAYVIEGRGVNPVSSAPQISSSPNVSRAASLNNMRPGSPNVSRAAISPNRIRAASLNSIRPSSPSSRAVL